MIKKIIALLCSLFLLAGMAMAQYADNKWDLYLLANDVRAYVKRCKTDPSPDNQTLALASYNKLRDHEQLSRAGLLGEIDENWLTSYWFKLNDVKLSDHDILLYNKLNEGLALLKEIDREMESGPSLKVIELYKTLCTYLGLTVPKVVKIHDQWLDEVQDELETLRYRIEYQYATPGILQERLIQLAAKKLGVDYQVGAWGAIPSGKHIKGRSALTSRGQGLVAIAETYTLESRLHTIYHELAHLEHQDPQYMSWVWNDEIDPDVLLEESENKEDRQALLNCLACGIKNVAVIDNTYEGRVLEYVVTHESVPEIFEQHKALWRPPVDDKTYKKVLYHRVEENRADLFALRRLYEFGNLNAIFTRLRDNAEISWGNEPVASSMTIQASNAEKALITLGFLISKGIDVRKEFYEWSEKGRSPLNHELEYRLLFDPSFEGTKGQKDVRAAYQRWKQRS